MRIKLELLEGGGGAYRELGLRPRPSRFAHVLHSKRPRLPSVVGGEHTTSGWAMGVAMTASADDGAAPLRLLANR